MDRNFGPSVDFAFSPRFMNFNNNVQYTSDVFIRELKGIRESQLHWDIILENNQAKSGAGEMCLGNFAVVISSDQGTTLELNNARKKETGDRRSVWFK